MWSLNGKKVADVVDEMIRKRKEKIDEKMTSYGRQWKMGKYK